MTRRQKFVLFGSLSFNVFCIVWVLWTTPIEVCGGQVERSPDGRWRADASSNSMKFSFAIGPHTDSVFERPPVRQVVITPTDQKGPLYFRSLPKIIQWSPDSSSASFTIPGVQVTLDVAAAAK